MDFVAGVTVSADADGLEVGGTGTASAGELRSQTKCTYMLQNTDNDKR